ncbi:MAG: protein-L-isoaspartate(D-aspartate) O-methyltransferase [Dehalococcoidia bacterium]|nr:protein-L-isoaspartate(D-aspartate) O-methyltransferase [Dehalococcoidia bacterium]
MDLEAARAELLRQLSREIWDRRVLTAMGQAPREFFVGGDDQHLAYANIPLPIASGQTISQPFIVALMTQSLYLAGTERVLEIGTGSGYQTAILAELAREVVSVERNGDLAEAARRRLALLGYVNVEIHLSNGSLGWPAGAPYQGIMVTAGAPHVPQPLLDQLDDGGRLVIPVGTRNEQDLLLLVRRGDRLERRSLGACRFVPLTGEEAWPEGQLS